jgi:hypothetical protein
MKQYDGRHVLATQIILLKFDTAASTIIVEVVVSPVDSRQLSLWLEP